MLSLILQRKWFLASGHHCENSDIWWQTWITAVASKFQSTITKHCFSPKHGQLKSLNAVRSQRDLPHQLVGRLDRNFTLYWWWLQNRGCIFWQPYLNGLNLSSLSYFSFQFSVSSFLEQSCNLAWVQEKRQQQTHQQDDKNSASKWHNPGETTCDLIQTSMAVWAFPGVLNIWNGVLQ